MAKYFKNVKNFEDLKGQFKTLLKANHPDNGGDVEAMKEINAEYDALFKIWKDRHEKQTGETVTETADSTRQQFYTMNGWEGSRHDWNRTLKEVAQIVRSYVKEKYPTYKFSVRTSYASMCQELHVDLKESPIDIYKTFEELTSEDFQQIAKRLFPWDYHIDTRIDFLNASDEEKKRIINDSNNCYKYILNEVTQAVIEDVDAFVKSYNYQDCDGMIDYFDVDFYYFGCCQNNGKNIKIVPKTARISTPKKEVKPKMESTTSAGIQALETDYTIEQCKHTKTNADIWLVKIVRTLTRDEYIKKNQKMKSLGGYYSKFTHSFIFDYDPTEKLTA